MYNVVYIKDRRKHKLKTKFDTEELAKEFITNSKALDEYITKIEVDLSEYDFEDRKGHWIWLYSAKEDKFLSYGKIIRRDNSFLLLQTKTQNENDIFNYDYTMMTIASLEQRLNSKKAYLKEDGNFNNLRLF